MSASELQHLKMAWLAAKEAGNSQEQLRLLRDYPGEQEALADFITAYYATGGPTAEQVALDTPVLTLTQRAYQRALDRVFVVEPALTATTLVELRKSLQLNKVEVSKGLRLGVDVWNKFEAGAIAVASLSQQQLTRLAQFFQVTGDQFGALLDNSQPAISMNRRQTREAADQEQGTRQQSFSEALQRSTMSKEDQDFWQV